MMALREHVWHSKGTGPESRGKERAEQGDGEHRVLAGYCRTRQVRPSHACPWQREKIWLQEPHFWWKNGFYFSYETFTWENVKAVYQVVLIKCPWRKLESWALWAQNCFPNLGNRSLCLNTHPHNTVHTHTVHCIRSTLYILFRDLFSFKNNLFGGNHSVSYINVWLF